VGVPLRGVKLSAQRRYSAATGARVFRGAQVETCTSARELPRHLLTDPDIVQALAARAFTTVFRAAKVAGLSYNAIAAATGLKAERISLVARGEASMTAIETVERIADGLHIPGGMLGLAPRWWETEQPTISTQPGWEDESMQRRKLLLNTLAAGLGAASLPVVQRILEDANAALADPADPADLAHLQAAAEQHSYGYGGRAPADVLAALVADFADVTPLMRRPQTAAARADTARVMAQLGGMAAVVLHDLGSQREAYRWFGVATRAADDAGDRTLQAWILARRAMLPINFGAPQAAAGLAEQARRAAGNGHTAAATLAAAVSARAYALAGRPAEASAAVRDADRLADSLPETETVDTWFGHCAQKHHVHLSHAYTALGQTGRARESQAHALALSAPTSTLTRTLLRIDAAACQHRDGYSREACAAAASALADVPARFRTNLTRSRAGDLYRSLPAGVRETPEARELADVLAS
jgi:transcriptional regulator with XRE-family HTH domain